MVENFYDIDRSIESLIKEFKKIHEMGWIEKKTSHFGEIGNNLELLLGKVNNDFQVPDFDGIELKTKKENAFNDYITLFNCTPYGNDFFEIKRLQEKYGYPDSTMKKYKILNTEVFSNYKKKIGNKYYFELKVDRKSRKIILLIFDDNKILIDKSTYWPFELLQQKLFCKLKYLAVVKVVQKYMNRKQYYNYNSLCVLRLKDFETFLDIIERGKIKILFKIGVFKSGKRIGQTHDRGTAFQININDINLIYDKIY